MAAQVQSSGDVLIDGLLISLNGIGVAPLPFQRVTEMFVILGVQNLATRAGISIMLGNGPACFKPFILPLPGQPVSRPGDPQVQRYAHHVGEILPDQQRLARLQRLLEHARADQGIQIGNGLFGWELIRGGK